MTEIEKVALELRKVGEDNNPTVIHGGQQMWLAVAKWYLIKVLEARLVEKLSFGYYQERSKEIEELDAQIKELKGLKGTHE